jgi:hypothetical protein
MAMASCKDCLHYDACGNVVVKTIEQFANTTIIQRVCNDFKDRTKYVEVVRCEDCKWVEKGKDYEAYCNHWESGLFADVKADDFCSYGERKCNE